MKHYEELSRLHIDEAIQTGLRSQSVHHALAEKKRLTQPASLEVRHSRRMNWLALLLSSLMRFGR